MKKGILQLIQILIFLLFLYSGLTKLSSLDVFESSLDKSIFFQGLNTRLIAISIIAVEFLIPVLIFFDKTSKAGLCTALLLLLLFTGYILLMFKFSPYMPCSCGGLIEKLSWKGHIAFNIVFMTLCGYSVLVEQSKRKIV